MRLRLRRTSGVAGVISLDALASAHGLESLHKSGSIHAYLLAPDGMILYHSDLTQVAKYLEAVASRVVNTTATKALLYLAQDAL
jgi:hypothetical protein